MHAPQTQQGGDAPASGRIPERDEPATPVPLWARPPDPAPVLVEVSGDVGLLLWLGLRDVLTWVAAPEAEWARVFPPGAHASRRARLARVVLPSTVSVPLSLLADLTGNPAGTRPLLVTRACLHLADNLRSHGSGQSALAFARAAVLACPDHARSLLEVARLLGATRRPDAYTCLQRAGDLAAERAEPRLCAEIHTELAALAFRDKDPRSARAHLLAALRAGRRGVR